MLDDTHVVEGLGDETVALQRPHPPGFCRRLIKIPTQRKVVLFKLTSILFVRIFDTLAI